MQPTSENFKRTVDGAVRRLFIAALGMAPEDPTDRYAATTGELRRWTNETQPEFVREVDSAVEVVLAPYRAAQIDKLFRRC